MSHIRVRQLSGIRALSAAPVSPDDLALINGGFAPVAVGAGDIHVRPARVAHNQHDRTLERFPKAYLERFAETLPGKSVLPGHDTRALPLGRWFRAETRTRQEQFPALVNPQKGASGGVEKAGVEIVPGFESQLRKVTWLDAAFYFTAGPETESLRRNIDSGVYQDVSIGFRYSDIDCDLCGKSYFSDCPHWRGQRMEDGTLVTLTYSGDPNEAEAQETSIVYLGAQQHAELMKSLRTGTVDPHAYAMTPLGEDLVRLKEAEALARRFGHQQKSWAFPALEKQAPVETETLEEQDSASLDAGKAEADPSAASPPVGGSDDPPAAVAAPTEERSMDEERRKALAKACGLPEDADEAKVLAALEAGAKTGKQALADLRQQILDDDLRLTGKETPSAELLEIVDMHVERGNYERLKALAGEKAAAVLEKFPAEPKGKTEIEDEAVSAVRPTRPREFALV